MSQVSRRNALTSSSMCSSWKRCTARSASPNAGDFIIRSLKFWKHNSRHLVETQPEALAHHLIAAGQIEKSIGYCLKAGLRSRDRFAHAEAINHFGKGLKLLEALEPSPERDARELELLGVLGHRLHRFTRVCCA